MEHAAFLSLVLFSFAVKGEFITCKDRNKCEDGRSRFIPLCYCDRDCFIYEDCCKEYFEAHGEANHFNKSLPTSLKCKLLTNQKSLNTERIGAFMVDRCKETDSLCQVTSKNLETVVPVSIGNTTYRNAECALCNNVTKFKYWNIAFYINPKVEKNLKNGKISSNENLVNNIKSVGFSEDLYFLLPPNGVSARFCPYDVRIKGETIEEKFNYQYTHYCNHTWYKNREICEKDGCCGLVQLQHCVGYNIELLTNADNIRSQSNNGFHLIIEFKPSNMDEEFHLQEKMSVEKLTFNNMEVFVIIELKESEKGFVSVEDCVYSIIAYLFTTDYLLVPESYHIFSIRMEEQDVQIFFLVLQSTAKLSLPTLTDLLQLQHYVQCEGKDGDVTANGKVNVSNMDKYEGLIRYHAKTERIMDLHRFRVAQIRISKSCGNLSFIIMRSKAWEIPVEVHCLDDEVTLEASQGCNLHRNVITLVVSLIMLFVNSLYDL